MCDLNDFLGEILFGELEFVGIRVDCFYFRAGSRMVL